MYATTGREFVAATRSRRRKAASAAREMLRCRREARRTGNTPLAGLATEYASRIIHSAPERLSTRRDIVRHARAVHTWAVATNRHTHWESLWCGQQDGLGDRLDGAHELAHGLMAYARTLPR